MTKKGMVEFWEDIIRERDKHWLKEIERLNKQMEIKLTKLAYHINNSRPDCYEPRKREREIQWDHTLSNLVNFLLDENSDFERGEFIKMCGGYFKKP